MRNLKKVIALIAVLALTLSTVALGATYTDVAEDSAYSVAVESLSKLGIVTGYEDGTYGPEKAVTRAEMAALIARIQGYGDTAKAQTNTVFTDVPSSHWASGYVAYAANQEIVNGYGDGTFGPDDTVKYEQAVTMIMRTLGYEYFASSNGGYPTGYLAAAQRYAVTAGVSNAVVGADANRGTIAQLLYNGIDTPIMAPFKWNTNGEVEYAIYDGDQYDYKTLMSQNLGVVKIKGIVLENTVTNIYDSSKAIELNKPAKVKVKLIDTFDSNAEEFKGYANKSITEMEDGDNEGKPYTEEFLVGESNIEEFLGKRVVLYAQKDNNTDEYEVVSVALDSTSNATAEFTLEQYAKLDTTGSKNKIEYFKNATDKDTTKLTIDDDAVVVYNNVGEQTVTGTFGDEVQVDSKFGGKVTLIDNNSSNGYDVIFVEIGATAVVEEVVGDKVVFQEAAVLANDDEITSIKVDDEAEDKIYKFYKDGAEISVADLVEWDVLTIVAAAKNSKYIVAEVIGTPVTGAITATKTSKTSESGLSYNIGGTYYDVAKNAYKADKLTIGDAGIFYVDKYGKIAAFDEDASVGGGVVGNYAFVLGAGLDEDDVAGNVIQVKLLTANGVDIYEFADSVSYYEGDGSGNRTNVKRTGFDTTFANNVKGNKNKVVKYATNASGEINAFYEAGYDEEKFVKVAENDGTKQAYDADNFSIGTTAIDEDAIVFVLSTAVSEGAGDITVNSTNYDITASESFVGTIADLEDKEKYNYIAYLDTKGDDANIVVLTTGYSVAGGASNIAVLTDVSVAVNDYNESVYVISYLQNGELKEGVYTNTAVYNANEGDLSVADIVKIKVSSDGLISALTVLVDFDAAIRSEETGLLAGATVINNGGIAPEQYDFDVIKAYTKGTKNVTMKTSGNQYKLSNAENVYVIDPTLKVGKVDIGSASSFTYDQDMADSVKAKFGDYVFARKYDNRVIDVVIVKGVFEDPEDEAGYVTKAEEATDAEADAKEAYDAAKATYDTALAAFNADNTNETKAAAVNTAIDDLQAAADDWNDAAVELAKYDTEYDATAAEDAKTAADALEDVEVVTP